MDDSIPCRLFVVLGEAGTGKTAFVRRLAADEELFHSVHICVYDRPSTRTVEDTLKDLAYVLAQNNSSYFDYRYYSLYSVCSEFDNIVCKKGGRFHSLLNYYCLFM